MQNYDSKHQQPYQNVHQQLDGPDNLTFPVWKPQQARCPCPPRIGWSHEAQSLKFETELIIKVTVGTQECDLNTRGANIEAIQQHKVD